MYKYIAIPFSEINKILKCITEFIDTDKKNFLSVTFIAYKNDVVVPIELADMLYVKILYVGNNAVSSKYFYTVKNLAQPKQIYFGCLIDFHGKENFSQLKIELDKIPLFSKNVVFRYNSIFIPIQKADTNR